MDGEKFPQDEEGEDEQFVVEEAVRPPARLPQNVFQSPGWELPGEERHGTNTSHSQHIARQIPLLLVRK